MNKALKGIGVAAAVIVIGNVVSLTVHCAKISHAKVKNKEAVVKK